MKVGVCALVGALAGVGLSPSGQDLVSVRNEPAYPVRLLMVSGSQRDGVSQDEVTLQLENVGDKPIIAFAVGYRRADEPETAKPRRAITFFAGAKSRMIAPGTIRPFPQKGSRTPEAPVVGQIDLVVFADGSTVGPNRLDEARNVQAGLLAQRSTLRNLLMRIREVSPSPTIEKMVEEELAAFPSVIKTKQPGEGEGVATPGR